MGVHRCRVLLAVSPRMLEDVLSMRLRSADVDDVVALADGPADLLRHEYDAVITNLLSHKAVHAGVVIELGENDGDTTAIVRTARSMHLVDLRQFDDVLAVLDRFCPSFARRASRVVRA